MLFGRHAPFLSPRRCYVGDRGCDARSVASLMGYSVPSTTLNSYGHEFTKAQEGAIAAVTATLEEAKARFAITTNGRG